MPLPVKFSDHLKKLRGATMNSTEKIIRNLEKLGHNLPLHMPPPAGLYEPFRLNKGEGYLAAQVSGYDNPQMLGRVGLEVSVETGVKAAEKAALFALGRIHQALDGFDRLIGLLHVAGHVSSADSFIDQPLILDGASRLFLETLEDRGKHTRTAYHHTRLPKNIVVELEITFAYREI
jgi:hypothetical protein